MLGLPRSTEFNRRIPKQKFYENLSVTPALKRFFIDQIKVIYWRNKIAPATMNLAAGGVVMEIEVFEVKLSEPRLDMSVLKQIDKEIPYHILFLLEYEGKYQAWTAYKESAASGSSAFKVGTYYHTDWMAEQELPLKIDGRDMDAVYEGFVRQIRASVEGEAWSAELSLKEAVALDEKRKQLQKQIAALQKKMQAEKQFNKQVQMNAEIKKLKKEQEDLC